jgi:hypothetical protein
MVWLLVAVFAGEWLFLLLVMRSVTQERLIPAVLTVVVLTILTGWVAVYLRIQRRIR